MIMSIIYYFLACISAVGIFLAGVYWKELVVKYKRYLRRLKRNNIPARIEWLEGRAKIHDNQNKGFHNRLDALDEQLNNIAETLSTRDRNRKYNTRRDVREYLQELQNK